MTKAPTPADAAAELARLLPAGGLTMVVVFLSSCYDPHRFAAEMETRFIGTPIFGCTTAGEIALDGWDENSVVALGFCATDFEVTAHPILGLSDFHIESGHSVSADRRLLSLDTNADYERCFGLLFIDGMCQREEMVLSAVYASVGQIPIVGGSAADGLRFERSWVLFGGCAHADAAVLLLVKTSLPFRTFSSDCCRPGTEKMVVTEADPGRRTVRELNAEPAAIEYSRIAGIASGDLDLAAFASHPVLVRVGDGYHARSIQRVDADGTLHFASAIDEGLVLTAAKPGDPISPTRELFEQIRKELGKVSLYIGFECIYRRISAEQHQRDRDMSGLYRGHRVFGCNTYGELYGARHVNWTLTGVAIGESEANTATGRRNNV